MFQPWRAAQCPACAACRTWRGPARHKPRGTTSTPASSSADSSGEAAEITDNGWISRQQFLSNFYFISICSNTEKILNVKDNLRSFLTRSTRGDNTTVINNLYWDGAAGTEDVAETETISRRALIVRKTAAARWRRSRGRGGGGAASGAPSSSPARARPGSGEGRWKEWEFHPKMAPAAAPRRAADPDLTARN